MKKFVVDFYTNPHMELREKLFEAAVVCGRCNFNDAQQWAAAQASLVAALKKLKDHGRSEDTYLHPILEPKLPHDRYDLDHDHEAQEVAIAHIETLMETLSAGDADHDRQQGVGIELYRSFNRFVGEYLMHLDDEEYLMHTIWKLFSQAELFAVMVAFKCIEEPEGFPMIMKMVDANLSKEEQKTLLTVINDRLGADILAKVNAAIQKI